MSEQPKQIGLTEDGRPIYAWPAQAALPPACTHQAPAPAVKPSGGAGKWIGIGIGGSFLAVALSVSMVAFAIGAVSVTICLLVLRQVWADFQRKG